MALFEPFPRPRSADRTPPDTEGGEDDWTRLVGARTCRTGAAAVLLSLPTLLLGGCAKQAEALPPLSVPLHAASDSSTVGWAQDTVTMPVATPPGGPCAQQDARLNALALELAQRASDPAAMSSEEFVFALRRSGSPYVWPEMMSLVTQPAAPEHAQGRVAEWGAGRGQDSSAGEGGGNEAPEPVRCGVATASIAGGARTVGIAAVPLAELATLPTQVHTGRWLVVRGTLHPGTEAAQVLVMGPRGRPQPLTTESENGQFRAAFAADQPGRWVVQVMATAAGGPRPVLEAWVYAGVAPGHAADGRAVPGEAGAAEGAGDSDASSLTRMLNGARAAEGVGRLRRNARLDALALEHAETMRENGRVAHDAGRGDAAERVRAANVRFVKLGENVARAPNPEAVHRALWASPAHRANLLDSDFREFGVAAVRGPDGTLWVCQLFATLSR